MPRLLSLLQASIAYDQGVEARRAGDRWRIELKPGENVISVDDAKRLDDNEIFHRHISKGHFQWLDNASDYPELRQQPAPEPEPVKPPAKPAKAPAAVANPELDKFVADFLALAPENQVAMLPTVTPEQAAAIAAAKAKG